MIDKRTKTYKQGFRDALATININKDYREPISVLCDNCKGSGVIKWRMPMRSTVGDSYIQSATCQVCSGIGVIYASQ